MELKGLQMTLNKQVLGALAVALILPAVWVAARFVYHEERVHIEKVDLTKVERLLEELKNKDPGFQPDALEDMYKKVLADFYAAHPGNTFDHEGFLGKLKDFLLGFHKDHDVTLAEMYRKIIKEELAALNKEVGKDPEYSENHRGHKYEWRQDTSDPTLWLYGHVGKDGIFWFSYTFRTGYSVQRCPTWQSTPWRVPCN